MARYVALMILETIALTTPCNSTMVADRPRVSFLHSSTESAPLEAREQDQLHAEKSSVLLRMQMRQMLRDAVADGSLDAMLAQEHAQGNTTGAVQFRTSPGDHARETALTSMTHEVKMIFTQSYSGTMSATGVFFFATWVFVLGMLAAAVLWIFCDSGAHDDRQQDPVQFMAGGKPARGFGASPSPTPERMSSDPTPGEPTRPLPERMTSGGSKKSGGSAHSAHSHHEQPDFQPHSLEDFKDDRGHKVLKAFREMEDSDSEEEDDDDGDAVERSPRSLEKHQKNLAKKKEKEDNDEMKKQFFAMNSDDLVDVMGLSGMTLLDLDASAGVSRVRFKIVLPLCALQAWMLQSCVLYYMAKRVYRLSITPPVAKDVPLTIIFAAIYLHFINCMNDLPFSLSILKYIPDLHPKREHLMIAMPIFVIDGLVVPCTSLLVGALYLCTSATVSDVILNSCAVAFVSNVDNWLLALIQKVNQASGKVFHDLPDGLKEADSCTVYLPVNPPLVKFMAWWLCVVPVVPWGFAMGMAHLGLDVLKL